MADLDLSGVGVACSDTEEEVTGSVPLEGHVGGGLKERRVRRREADVRLGLAMEVIEGGYWHYDVGRATFETSPQLTRFVTGSDAKPFDLEGFVAQVLPEDRHQADLSRLISGEEDRSVAEYRVVTHTGGVRWMRCRRRLVRDDDDEPTRIIGMAIDVTEQKSLQSWVERQAKTDPLTSLGNRRGFEERAEVCLDRARASRASYGFGLLMLDLDGFKPINDRHGHLTGDGILQIFAHRLSGTVRPIDYVARLGGDEFAILVDDADDLNLCRLAERLVRVVAEPMEVNHHTFEVGCSIGAARFRPGDLTLQGLVGRADAALYDAKHKGRRTWKLSA